MALPNALLQSICPAAAPPQAAPSSLVSKTLQVFGGLFIVILTILMNRAVHDLREGIFESVNRFYARTEGSTWEWREGKLIERHIEQNQEWIEVETEELEEDDDVEAKLSRLEDAMEEVRFATEELRYATDSYEWDEPEDEN
jgi:hypothetical protein